jgi:formylglycine-generating enzyme required for sulfatase activity
MRVAAWLWLSLAFAVVLFAARDTEAGRPRARAKASDWVTVLRPAAAGRVLIRRSVFTMGSDQEDIALALALCRSEPMGEECQEEWFADEFAPHSVELSDYWIDRTEVTMGDYLRCVEVGPCAAPPLAAGGRRFLQPDLPATMVTWGDAQTFCAFRGGRLPTEAEWERAARGTKGRRYPWGNVFDPYLANGGRFGIQVFEDKDGFLELAPVGSFVEGGTPDRIVDLVGNAEEWVADWWAPEYPMTSETNPKGPTVGDEKIVRGGSYLQGKHSLRAAERNKDVPSARRPWRGFRCAYDP